uniref:Odorant receptor n=1 Tax=Apriona germarii TaxID=157307 RepID=A0A7G7WND5_APRGE|nr:odorant receptor 37 [Apriona germarii]
MLHISSAVFFVSFALLYNLLGIVNALQNIYDLKKFSTTVSYLLKGVSYTCKIGNLLIFKKNLLLLDDMQQDPIIAELQSEEEEIVLKKSLKSSKMLKKFYIAYIVLSVSIQAIYPLVNKSGSNLWYPFNSQDHFFGVHCFEMLEVIISSCFNAAANMLTVTLMDMSATQFILLEHRLQRIEPGLSQGDIMEDILEKIQNYVDHHNYVYSFTALVEKTFSIGIFCQMGCSVLVVIISVLRAVVMPIKSVEFLIMAAFCLSMICEIALYCCYGQKILDASNKITESCYMSKWYQCDLEVQKYLSMVMNRGNKSVIMKAIGVFPLTLETLMSICSSAYSFFAILVQIHEGSE